MPKQHKISLILSLLLALIVMAFGLYMLTLSEITRFRQWPYYMLPRGEIIIMISTLLAVFCKQIGYYLLWLGNKLYRVIAALMIFALIGVDGLLHVFSIPHVEGWWLSLASSLIAASGTSAWIEKHKKGQSHE